MIKYIYKPANQPTNKQTVKSQEYAYSQNLSQPYTGLLTPDPAGTPHPQSCCIVLLFYWYLLLSEDQIKFTQNANLQVYVNVSASKLQNGDEAQPPLIYKTYTSCIWLVGFWIFLQRCPT